MLNINNTYDDLTEQLNKFADYIKTINVHSHPEVHQRNLKHLIRLIDYRYIPEIAYLISESRRYIHLQEHE